MASVQELLPLNATQLEKDILSIFPFEELYDAATQIKTAKTVEADIPDSAVPWLFLEFGLGDLSDFLDVTEQEALSTGKAFNLIRGTLSSIKTALGWVGITDPVIEDDPIRPWNFIVTTEQLLTDLTGIQKLVQAILISKAIYTRLGGVSNVTGNVALNVNGPGDINNNYIHGQKGVTVANTNPAEDDINVYFKKVETEFNTATGTIATVLASRILLKLIKTGGNVYRRTRYKFYVTEDVGGDLEVDGTNYSESGSPTDLLYMEFLINEGDITTDDITNMQVVYSASIDSGVLAATPGKEYWSASDVTASTLLKDLTLNTVPRAEYIENIIRLVFDFS